MSVSTMSRSIWTKSNSNQFLALFDIQFRSLTTKQFSPTITYLTKREPPSGTIGTSKNSQWDYPTERPLSILLCWLMAKTRAVNKYANFYLDKGYDVLTVRITPTQLLLPTRANRIVEKELMPILSRSHHPKAIIHGFSVGGYVFAQMLRFAKENPEYAPIIQKMVAQIWDSVVDVQGTAIGVSKAVFPKVALPQRLLKDYIDFHMKVMEGISTKHYYVAHDYYYNFPLQAPALFLNSENDPISAMSVIQAVQDTWTSNHNISVTQKIWANTPHVGHMQRHPDEYKHIVTQFLDQVGVKGQPRERVTETVPDFNPAYNVITT